jgi:hypothetical protein
MDVLLDFESRYHFGILVAHHDLTKVVDDNHDFDKFQHNAIVLSSMLLLKTTNTFCIFVIFIIDGTVSNGIDVGSGDKEL